MPATSRSRSASWRSRSSTARASRAINEAAADAPEISTVCRLAAAAATWASRAAPRTPRLSSQRASRAWPSRRIAVGVWKPLIKMQRALVGEVQNSFQRRKGADVGARGAG